MGLFAWVDSKTKNFNKWYDFSVLKLTMVAFALWLAIIWPDILSLPTWIYFVVFVIGWIYLWWKMFK